METYLDILSGDPFLSDKFPHQEILPGMLWEVKGTWTVIKSHADNCTCPFESYEAYDSIGCGDDLSEIDIVWEYNLEEIGGYSKREFLFEFFVRVADALTGEAKVKFVKGFGQALTYIRSKNSANLQCYSGVTGQGGLIFVYHDPDPTFIYFVHNLVKPSEMPTIPKPLPPTSAHSPSIHRGPTNLSYQDILTVLDGSLALSVKLGSYRT